MPHTTEQANARALKQARAINRIFKPNTGRLRNPSELSSQELEDLSEALSLTDTSLHILLLREALREPKAKSKPRSTTHAGGDDHEEAEGASASPPSDGTPPGLPLEAACDPPLEAAGDLLSLNRDFWNCSDPQVPRRKLCVGPPGSPRMSTDVQAMATEGDEDATFEGAEGASVSQVSRRWPSAQRISRGKKRPIRACRARRRAMN